MPQCRPIIRLRGVVSSDHTYADTLIGNGLGHWNFVELHSRHSRHGEHGLHGMPHGIGDAVGAYRWMLTTCGSPAGE